MAMVGVHSPAAAAAAAGAAIDLQALIDSAQPGTTVRVPAGLYEGPLLIDKPLKIIGDQRPTLDGGGHGTVVRITAPMVELRGFYIRGTGRSLVQEDSAVMVTAAAVVVADNIIEDALFGIVIKNGSGGTVRDNHITGKDLELSLVGDGIRLWYSHDSRVLDNTVQNTREVLLENSRNVVFSGNFVRGGRQGLHLMRIEDARVENNLFTDNAVGMYAMYVHGLTARGNQAVNNRGPSGYGIALKDGSSQLVEENVVIGNNIGLYFDNSPERPDMPNSIRANVVLANDIGLVFTPSTNGNHIWGNDIMENLEQVAIAGGGSLGPNEWTGAGTGNHWSDYAGYDADGDGIGDYPYRSVRLFENLMSRQPLLRWFRFSPAAVAVDFSARAFPAVAPEPILTDPAPLMRPRLPKGATAPAWDRIAGSAVSPPVGRSGQLTPPATLPAALMLAVGLLILASGFGRPMGWRLSFRKGVGG